MTLLITSDRRQLKRLLTIVERGSKIARNIVFHCHLWPLGLQMAIENFVSNDVLSMLVDNIYVFDCCLSDVLIITSCLCQ